MEPSKTMKKIDTITRDECQNTRHELRGEVTKRILNFEEKIEKFILNTNSNTQEIGFVKQLIKNLKTLLTGHASEEMVVLNDIRKDIREINKSSVPRWVFILVIGGIISLGGFAFNIIDSNLNRTNDKIDKVIESLIKK